MTNEGSEGERWVEGGISVVVGFILGWLLAQAF